MVLWWGTPAVSWLGISCLHALLVVETDLGMRLTCVLVSFMLVAPLSVIVAIALGRVQSGNPKSGREAVDLKGEGMHDKASSILALGHCVSMCWLLFCCRLGLSWTAYAV